MSKARVKTIMCQECSKRFVPVRSGRGIRKVQTCPHCDKLTTPPETMKELKDRAWREFARLVKLDELANYGRDGIVKCCTCPAWLPWDDANMHAGHYLAGRNYGTLFIRPGVNCQCAQCNFGMPWAMRKSGSSRIHERYTVFMIDRYGSEMIEYLTLCKHQYDGNWRKGDLRELILEFHNEAKKLAESMGILFTC